MKDLIDFALKEKYEKVKRLKSNLEEIKILVDWDSVAKLIPKNSVTLPLISQFVRSGTSIGANYCEADDAESRKDFKHKMGIAKKEARETKHWLRMVTVAAPELEKEAKKLWQEAKELHLIFNAIVHSTIRNSKD